MKRVAFCTLGCKVNQYETNKMVDLFKEAGYQIVEFDSLAEVYVINTCTVTNMGDRKSRQVFHRARELNPEAVVCVVGCYAQVAGKELEKVDEIDIVLGTNDRKSIVMAVEQFFKEHKRIQAVTDIMSVRQYSEWGGTAYTTNARAEIKIQDGCDRFCTYCLIPYARGPVRSRKLEEIVEECKKIAQSGIQEVILTGIHISSYGKDLKEKIALIDVLESIHEIDGIQRIRLGSLEPLIITEGFVSRLKALSKVCNHFHLSLQSGCDETLQRMNRRYTTNQFREIVNLLRKEIPEVALTTDVIVGFPGETEEEFENTYSFLKEIQFSKMHVFKYSPRKGTKAATFPNQVDGMIKNERSERLIALSNQYEKEFAQMYLNQVIEVLFENEQEGHTTNYIKVVSEKPRKRFPEMAKVVPKSFQEGCLIV